MQILGLSAPWKVESVEVDSAQGEIRVYVGLSSGERLQCPDSSQDSPGYDKRRRRWRHLDRCQFKTILIADVPRVECGEHGVRSIPVPWAAPGSGLTALFESLLIDWLGEASTSAVSSQLRISWNAIDGVKQRAVERGLSCRAATECTRIGVDETAFKKRHDYITVVSDQDDTVRSLAEEPGIHENRLYKSRRRYSARGAAAFSGNGVRSKPVGDVEKPRHELEQTKRALAKAEMEKDIS